MMRGVGHPPHHGPRPAVRRIEKGNVLGPPRLVLFSQPREPSAGIVRVALDEGQAGFRPRERRGCRDAGEPWSGATVFALAPIAHVLVGGPVTGRTRGAADVE